MNIRGSILSIIPTLKRCYFIHCQQVASQFDNKLIFHDLIIHTTLFPPFVTYSEVHKYRISHATRMNGYILTYTFNPKHRV
jgi:hypothetical protein